MIKLTLPNGDIIEVTSGTTIAEAAASLSGRLAKDAVCGRFNGELKDLSYRLTENGKLEIVTTDSPDGVDVMRHTVSHVMAQAVQRLWPGTKLAIGPTIQDGFYYDFDMEHTLSSDDLEKIEAEMAKIIAEDYEITREELAPEAARALFESQNATYKLELIEGLDEQISVYRQGEFVDLCRGPHLPSTGRIKAFKLLSVAGAYWRGDSRNKMLQRVYGTAFFKKSQLDEYLKRLEEAAKRDHRKIGRELDLFSIVDEGPGFPFFHPKGMVLRNVLENFWREEHIKRGYSEVKTPIMLREELWHRSGHWDHYKDNMYFSEIENQRYAVKPMNCPGGILMYQRKIHSYRDLPIRMGELGLVHRHELSGTLHGLMRVRSFTQDDAHIFMRPDQVEAEIIGVIDLIDYVYKIFGFPYHVELSTKPKNAMGDDAIWDMATDALRKALENKGLEYKVNEGDGAFYGPKIDFHLQDCVGRTWQCATIQLDFLLPERFDLYYIGEDGQKHRPVMLHRVVFGALERFIAILTEHFAGAFPTWLAPVQVMLIPVAEDHLPYAREIAAKLSEFGIRYEIDERNEKIGRKIREAQLQQIPYMLVVGTNEMNEGTVAVRHRRQGDLGKFGLERFIEQITSEIKEKKLD
ncbi:MAG: threonine--tRNA ligase [Limnochordia bacterium]|nr:threonine--tRNA ligase [Bacillota bacterium]HOB08561.1 threonine--tRNA ligase [Limnochordia bacterium]NLH32172.1 threonine--tRNA ligase [Bacillota bacterium]HPT92709.1 threonine--tRNA ligase [Limnochordia bacterium]HPZ30702.1 threonine--tRNA ligase [Limnochordia bacterium]